MITTNLVESDEVANIQELENPLIFVMAQIMKHGG
jgi:hypothetical protein